MLGGNLTFAKASTETPYGNLSSFWKIEDNKFSIEVEIPYGSEAEIILPSGKEYKVPSGKYSFEENI